MPVDEKTKAQMRYGMRQFIDAMSPANFFMTNPEAMQLAAETGGQSVLNGMNLFFEDLAKGWGGHVTWIKPDDGHSEHPVNGGPSDGQKWVPLEQRS